MPIRLILAALAIATLTSSCAYKRTDPEIVTIPSCHPEYHLRSTAQGDPYLVQTVYTVQRVDANGKPIGEPSGHLHLGD